MSVNIIPIPAKYRAISNRLRPKHPPIFSGDPSDEEIELARALFLELDPESKRWYRRTGSGGIFADL